MPDYTGTNNDDGHFADDERIDGLYHLDTPIEDDFFVRIEKAIERRTAAARLATFACDVPPLVAFELGQIFAHIVRATAASKTTNKGPNR